MTQVIRQNDITFAFSSPLTADSSIGRHTGIHGDGVRDVAFRVNDVAAVLQAAIAGGGVVVKGLERYEGADGVCITATIKSGYQGTLHTFVERGGYNGVFLPGYMGTKENDPQIELVEASGLRFVDHCVANQEDGMMEGVVEWYVKVLGFHRFWSVDDSELHTEFSSLRSIVVADFDENVKMPINEPASGRGKSQIQEFVEYYNGPGIQHIALNTEDIVRSVERLRRRGVVFISVPKTYYEDLRRRLGAGGLVKEDIEELEGLGILVDFDERGYLLQIFTKAVMDRPTVFFEIIQRRNHEGFGVGNFKSLFEAIEREQALRGNL